MRIIVCQHVPYEPLGTLLPLLRNAKIRIRFINFGRNPDAAPKIDGYDGVILLGGPMSANDTDQFPHLQREMNLITEAWKRRLPVLGICLGSQLIAKAFGAEVSRLDQKEIGWHALSRTDDGSKDPLFSRMAPEEQIFQWHGDGFSLPKGARSLATSKLCQHQAFSLDGNIYGFQFHMEADENLIERWLTIPEHQEEIQSSQSIPDEIRQATVHNIGRMKQLSETIFGGFLELIGHSPTGDAKRPLLPSR